MSVPQVDVSSYNRFLLTAGIALIALALLAPWLLLTEAPEPLISKSELTELSPASRDAISRRHHIEEEAYDAVWWVSGVLALAGSTCLVTGANRLRRRQPVADRLEDLDLLEREHRVRQLDEQERTEKLDQ